MLPSRRSLKQRQASKEGDYLMAPLDFRLSDAFQEFGNVEVAKEQLMVSVNRPRITGRQSLRMRIPTLSRPGDLLEVIDDTICSTCVQVNGVKLNNSSDEVLVVGGENRLVSEILMILSMANCASV